MVTLLIDLSHHNAEPDWAALKAGGCAGVILKATEGTSFADPVFAARRARAHAQGLAVGMYGFADLGSAAAEAAWFAKVVGALAPGEFVGLDEEVTKAGVDPVVWAGQWIDALAALGVDVRLLYINKAFLAAHDWTPIVRRGVLLWLADYDGSPTAPAPSGPWPRVELKQYTDAGSVPGASGVDVDALLGALTDLTGAVVADYIDWAQEDKNALVGDILHFPLLTNMDGVAVSLQDVLNAIERNTRAATSTAAGMTCQGNPKAVLSALGQAANAAASAT